MIELGSKSLLLKRIRLIILLLMVLVLILPIFSPIVAHAVDSNDRRVGVINLGKGKQETGGDVLDTLTGDQLKTLGVFLSNYYVPFSTQLGPGRNEEEEKQITQQMVDSLTKTGNFTEQVATPIVKAVLEVSKKPEKLYFAYSTDGGDSYSSAKTNGEKGRQATFYEFLDQISGWSYKSTNSGVSMYPDKSDYESGVEGRSLFTDENYGYKEGSKLNRGSLYWGGKEVDKSKVVFDWNPAKNWVSAGNDNGGQTASQTVMAQIYQYLDGENSVGTAFLDYTADERGGDTKSQTISSLIESLKLENGSIESIYGKSMYDWTMWVDAFGNILVDTGVRQYVVVPAAMNPYVFKKMGQSSDGTELDYGRSVPVNNLISITLAGQSKLITGSPTQTTATFNIGNINDNFPSHPNTDKLRAIYKFPSSGDAYWNEKEVAYDWGASMLDALTTQYGMKMFGIDAPEGVDKKSWLKLNGAPDNIERHKSKLPNYYVYGFNSATLGHAVIVPRSGINPNPKHYIIQDLVAFDTFGLLTNDKFVKEDIKEDSLLRGSLWNDDGTAVIDLNGIDSESAFGQKLTAERNKVNTASNQVLRDYSSNLYVTYILAGLEAENKVGFKIGFNRFPTYDGKTVLSNLDENQQMTKNVQEVLNMAYFFLHPTEGVDYFSRWAKTKISSVLVGWHNDMTGANDSEYSSGMTKYLGFSGFTTMPQLTDMEWTDWMVQSYLDWGIYIIIAVVILMVIYIALGEVSIQRAILGIAIFSVCLYIPPTAINSTVGLTNSISDAIYSNKFLYWGIMQLQTYSGKVDELAEAGGEGKQVDYARSLLSMQGGNDGLYANNSSLGNGVRLKWMVPKKDNYLEQIQKELDTSTGGSSSALAPLTDSLLRKSLSGETYLESNNAVYLYRTFSDITNYSRFYYGNLMADNVYGKGTLAHDISDISESLSTVGMGSQYQKYVVGTEENSLLDRKNKGFINDVEDAVGGTSNNKNRTKRIYAPLSSTVIAKSANVNLDNLQVGDKVGVSSDYFNASIANLNNHEANLATQLSSDISSNELASTSSFALYTESPYYYFSWSLYDNGVTTQSGSSDSFRRLMLSPNDEFFYNYKISEDSTGYGALKDYLDMGSLFTTVIPYLRQVNAPIVQWSEVYGTQPYLDVSTKESDADQYQNADSESYYKYWYNVNLSRLFNTYTAWVDAMYDSSYAKSEKISYGGESQIVQDPINPASYTVRPMIFSESEMEYYGLKEYNLTNVEQKILKVQRETRNDLLQLLNYQSFDSSVLNSTASMIMTFNFNKEFSQNNFMAESYVQYPQGFELKNFTYDAYLRLILSNTTGEAVSTTDGMATLYERVVENSSILTGILLVLGDILAVYVIPLLKFVFLVVIFILSILTIFVKAMGVEISFFKVLWKSLAKPLIQFCVVTIGHSMLISLFMSNGLTDVTGDTSVNISLGDPSITLIALILINSIAIVLYALITWGLIKDLISYGRLSYNAVSGVLSAGLSLSTSKLGGIPSALQGRLGSYGGSETPSSSSYSSNPEERGRNNVKPEYTVESDIRARDINTRTYGEELNVRPNRDSLNVDSIIESGRSKVEGKRVVEQREDSTDERKPPKVDSSRNMDDIKKHADEIKDKYKLD